MVDLSTAAALAFPALSGFRVGAVALGASGRSYFGCNVEFLGLPLSETIHAEQCAIANAAFHGERGIVSIAVSVAPCGYCRQFLFELSGAARLEIELPGRKPQLLIDYLPGAFGPGDLGVAGGLLASAPHQLALNGERDELALAALRAANRSYAPYTNSAAGAALRTREGRIFTGFAMENAAYNPSLAPLQAAIAVAVVSGVKAADIVEAAVVEAADSKLGYAARGREVLKSFCPGAQFQSFGT